jgi:hypothetical protein
MTPERRQDLIDHVHALLENVSRICELSYREGKHDVLWTILAMHALIDRPLPDWVRLAIILAESLGARSWEDIFGKFPTTEKKSQVLREEIIADRVARQLRDRGHKIKEDFPDKLRQEIYQTHKISITFGTARNRFNSDYRKSQDRVHALAAHLDEDPNDTYVMLFAALRGWTQKFLDDYDRAFPKGRPNIAN